MERAFFETRMGTDLSAVRIHDGNHADRASRAIGARAFTLGRDIAFARGEFRPGTGAGRRLIAHELAHVLDDRSPEPTARRDLALQPQGPIEPETKLTGDEIQQAIDFNKKRFKKQDQIELAFYESADESLIEDYETGLQEAIDNGDTRSSVIQLFFEMELAIWKGDLDKLVEMANTPMDITEAEYAPIFFSLIRMLEMDILIARGDRDQAREVAQSILEQEDVILAQNLSRCGGCFLEAWPPPTLCWVTTTRRAASGIN